MTKWVGPYVRAGAETNLLPADRVFEEARGLRLLDVDGTLLRTRITDRQRITPPFGLSTLKEGVGINLRLFKEVFAETTVRTGVGARHRIARYSLFEEADISTTPEFEFKRIGSSNQVGIEGTLLAVGRLTRWVLLNLEVDALLPFDDVKAAILEVEASVGLKLTSYLSVNYVLRFLRDQEIRDRDAFSQDLLLRFSVEVF
ncbi:MAG: hypothetical protein IPK13_16660 [Deltaproteobacteria bacterium]|nr:hypothetical protein [Deltaproteobacteria bacterium]